MFSRLKLFCFLYFYFLQPICSYFQSSAFVTTQIDWTRARKLQTAGSQLVGFIPKLEPGLRYLRSTKYLIKYDQNQIEFINFPLNFLEEKVPQAEEEKTEELNNLFSDTVTSKPVAQLNLDGLFGRVQTSLKTFSKHFLLYLRKVVATSMLFASSMSTPSNLKKAALATGSLVGSFSIGPKLMANAGVFRNYHQLTPAQKLATTPVYYISNTRGNAYLQEDRQAGNPKQRIVTYFMSYEDAFEYLHEMTQSNPASANEIRVSTTSMEKVMNQIKDKKQSRKLGRYEIDLISRIQPSSKQCKNAEKILGNGNVVKGHAALKGNSVPMFSAKGLAIKRAGGEVVTPYYFAYEDLVDDWSKMVAKNPDMNFPKTPKVFVSDMTDVLCLSKGISSEYLEGIVNDLAVREDDEEVRTGALTTAEIKEAMQNPGIVPPRNEIESIKKFYRNQDNGVYRKAKLMAQP